MQNRSYIFGSNATPNWVKRKANEAAREAVHFLPAKNPNSVKSALDKAAREDARTISNLVAKILMDWLAGRK